MKSRLLGAAILLCGAGSTLRAQDPSREYFTIATTHFRVSFTRPLESVARRVAASAERAYAQLSADLRPPRGTIDVLVTDDFDFANGSATTYPTNRIVVHAMPPVNDFSLRYNTDWAQLVVTHELAHIFHLDRVRGIWRVGQAVFGRSPFLFPNLYQPAWLIEGLAVYEETRHAGQGRLESPEHRILLRAASLDRFPRIGDASLARPTFPQGNASYGYGSLFLEYLARTRGDSAIGRLVEASSKQIVPYLIDIPARSAFGVSFGAAWREWRNSFEAAAAQPPLPDWTPLVTDQLSASYPRWVGADRLSFTGSSGRDVTSAWEVTTAGDLRRTGARNGLSPTVRLSNGDLLFAQHEYIGPYSYRSDLYTQRPGERGRRLTTGQRLIAPDARADGGIVATQVVAGATRIVRVGATGAVTPITDAHPDTLYNEPRWSHSGDRIAASRWIRGGISQIVVMDSSGRDARVLVSSARQIAAWPSWSPDDQYLAFSSGVDGYQVRVADGRIAALGHSPLGILEPELGPSRAIAALTLGARGYALGVATAAMEPDANALLHDTAADPRLPALTIDSTPAVRYSVKRQLVPRYWVPVAEEGFDGAYLIGGNTEAWDILRRHHLYAEARLPTDNSGINWAVGHQYRGFGRPVISTDISQDWTPFPVFDQGTPRTRVGTLRRRLSDAQVLSTFVRQRVRSALSFSVGAGVERRDYFGDPPSIKHSVDTAGTMFTTAHFPRLTASASYARYFTPPFAISAEDGFSVAVTARERLKSTFNGTGGASTSLVGALSLFRALDLPGYAHHVVALRGSAGWTDTRANAYFDVGGVSGGTYQVFPGYTVGEGRRTFPVRGFAPGTAQGIRAATASVEYRAPLSLAHRSLSTLPTFLQRSALTLFSDYGVAWCPNTLATRQVCTDPAEELKTDLASVGGELTVNAGLLSWDVPTRLRLGIAVPVLNGSALGARSLTPYFTTGISF